MDNKFRALVEDTVTQMDKDVEFLIAHGIDPSAKYSNIPMYYPDKDKTYVVSILTRKKYDTMIEILSQDKNARFIFTSGNNDEEFTSKEILYDCAKNVIPEEKIEMMDLEKALRTVIKEGQLTFVIGSFHMYKLVRNILQKQ